MWTRSRASLARDDRSVVERVRTRQWKNAAERQELLRRIAAIRGLPAEDLAALLTDSDPAVREAGALALRSQSPADGGAALLAVLAKQPDEAQKKTFDSYVALQGGDIALPVLAELLADRRAPVVTAALGWIQERPNAKFAPLLASPLETAATPLRRRILDIAGKIGAADAEALAARAADDEDEGVRLQAIGILARSARPDKIEWLLRGAADASEGVRAAAEAGLAVELKPGSPAWEKSVLPRLADPSAHARAAAVRLLRDQEPAFVVDAFIAAFREVRGTSRDNAIETFKELGPKFVKELADRAGDPDPGVSHLAALTAVTLETPEIVPLCVRLLKHPDWWLRHRAAEALSRIRDERALEPLIELLKDRESDLTAAVALGDWGTPKSLPGLLAAYKGGAKDLRLEILEAFSKIRDPRVPALLQNIVNVDPEPVVREKAARLLRALEGRGDSTVFVETARSFEPVNFASGKPVTLEDLFTHARALDASDIHLAVNAVPHLRLHGVMTPLPLDPLTEVETEAMVLPILSDSQRAALAEHRHIDFCHKAGALGRFRTNIFFQRKGLDAVFRLIPADMPRLEDIGLPESLWELADYSQGLILVTGPAGCGKTTTLAAFVDRINRSQASHVITIEDPIEYVHSSRNSLVTQREIPTHSASFAKALRQAFREDPDVLMVGEMRDAETISLAVMAAETGHLVLGTLNTATAAGTIDRIIDAFPPGQQQQIRQMVADSLRAAIAQSLLPRRDGNGRIAAFEILRNTGNVAGLIRDEKTFQLPSAIQTGVAAGMQTMDAAMLKLVEEGVADPRAAYDRAVRKELFEPHLRSAGESV